MNWYTILGIENASIIRLRIHSANIVQPTVAFPTRPFEITVIPRRINPMEGMAAPRYAAIIAYAGNDSRIALQLELGLPGFSKLRIPLQVLLQALLCVFVHRPNFR